MKFMKQPKTYGTVDGMMKAKGKEEMNMNATKYLMNMFEVAYDTDCIDSMDDVIDADNAVEKILATTYKNADYKFLAAYAEQLRKNMVAEVGIG